MEQKKSTVSNRAVIKTLWNHVWKYKWHVVIIVAGIGINAIANLLTPWFMRGIINALSGSQPVGLVLRFFLYFILATIISNLSFRFVSYSNSDMQPRVMADLVKDSFDYTLGHSYQFFSDTFIGSLVRKINRLSRSFERLADELSFNLLPTIFILAGTCIGLAFSYPLVSLIYTVWIIIFVIFNYYAAKWKMPFDLARSEADSKSTGVLSDSLSNNLAVKVFNGTKHERSLYNEVVNEWQSLYIKGWIMGEHVFSIQTVFVILIEGILMYYAIILWSQGKLSVGDVALVQTYLTLVFSHVWSIGRAIRNLHEGMAEAKEMVEILDTPYEVQDLPKAKKLKVTEGKIEFKNVDFNYHETRSIFKGLEMAIKPGEKVALVGTSGAGKSTVTKLLFRFYDLTGGQILIDGQDISKVTQESLRYNLALVPQEPVLFHRSMKENIQYGRLDSSMDEVIDAAKKAQCHDFIASLPLGYETFVGERGIKLSGGERQRVAIARAILKNAPILVLDEATSSLDSESEQLIQKALGELMKGKTTIVIAHRLSTIMQMDRIIVIEEGRVIDEGTHQELLSRQGIYKKLWEIQAGGFLVDADTEK